MGTVANFPLNDHMTPEQALAHAQNRDWKEVVVIGHDSNDYLFIISSQIDRKSALWLAEKLRDYALGECEI